MSKYGPLTEHLKNHAASEWRASFSDIEEVIIGNLPASARVYNAWWSNDHSSPSRQCRYWMDVGWQTKDLDLVREKVTFYKVHYYLKRPSRGDGFQPRGLERRPRGPEGPPHPNPGRQPPPNPAIQPHGLEMQPRGPEPPPHPNPENHRGPSWSVVALVLVSVAILVLHVGRVYP